MVRGVSSNSLHRTTLYNEAANELMVELGIPQVDVGSVTAFRWVGSHVRLPARFPLHCHYPHNASDFEGSPLLL